MVIKRNNNLPHVEIICFLYSDKKWRGQATPSRKMPGIPLLLEKTKIPSGKLSANIYLLVKDRENIYCCPRFNLYTYDNIHIFINKNHLHLEDQELHLQGWWDLHLPEYHYYYSLWTNQYSIIFPALFLVASNAVAWPSVPV